MTSDKQFLNTPNEQEELLKMLLLQSTVRHPQELRACLQEEHNRHETTLCASKKDDFASLLCRERKQVPQSQRELWLNIPPGCAFSAHSTKCGHVLQDRTTAVVTSHETLHQECINARVVEVPLSYFREETMDVAKLVPQERIDELFVDVPVPQIFDGTVEVEKLATQDRINERIVEVPVPHFREETMEVAKLVPQERIDDELFVDVTVP